MNAALLAVIALSTIVEGVPPPKGPDRTRLCIQNATDELVGVWIWSRLVPLTSRLVEPTRTDCVRIQAYSQAVMVVVGKGERSVPGTVPLFPPPSGPGISNCPNFIEGGDLRFVVTKRPRGLVCEARQ